MSTSCERPSRSKGFENVMRGFLAEVRVVPRVTRSEIRVLSRTSLIWSCAYQRDTWLMGCPTACVFYGVSSMSWSGLNSVTYHEHSDGKQSQLSPKEIAPYEVNSERTQGQNNGDPN